MEVSINGAYSMNKNTSYPYCPEPARAWVSAPDIDNSTGIFFVSIRR